MGDFLDKCASDAWDIMSGRKKIIRNKIVSCECNELKEATFTSVWNSTINSKF